MNTFDKTMLAIDHFMKAGNPNHGPDGRFTSGGGASAKQNNQSQMGGSNRTKPKEVRQKILNDAVKEFHRADGSENWETIDDLKEMIDDAMASLDLTTYTHEDKTFERQPQGGVKVKYNRGK